MMENLYDILKHIYPDLDIGLYGAVQLVDLSDGLGPRISVWNDPRPQPTEAELLAVIPEVERGVIKEQIDDLAAAKIAVLFNKPTASLELAFKEMTLLARYNELQGKLITNGSVTPDEQVELDSSTAIWEQVKAIKANGKQLQVSLQTADPYTFDINVGW